MAASAIARASPPLVTGVSLPTTTNSNNHGRKIMNRRSILALTTTALLTSTVLAAGPATAAEVTFDRLVNADKEPHNWLMNHRTYDGQRFSPLARINKDNVKGLKLAYAMPLGGAASNEYNHATPLVEDGFLYTTDSSGVLYKI